MTRSELINKWKYNLEFTNNLPEVGDYTSLLKNGQLVTIKEILKDLDSLDVKEEEQWISVEKLTEILTNYDLGGGWKLSDNHVSDLTKLILPSPNTDNKL